MAVVADGGGASSLLVLVLILAIMVTDFAFDAFRFARLSASVPAIATGSSGLVRCRDAGSGERLMGAGSRPRWTTSTTTS